MSKLWNRTLRPNNIYPALIQKISMPDATRLLVWMNTYKEENPGGEVTICLNEDAVDWDVWNEKYGITKEQALALRGRAKVDEINNSNENVIVEWVNNEVRKSVPKRWIKEVR